jgi:penicillin-insensitive murein DD-endopeptidase
VQKPGRLALTALSLALALSLHSGAASAADSAKAPRTRGSAEAPPAGGAKAKQEAKVSRAPRARAVVTSRGSASPRQSAPKPPPETPPVSVGHPNEGRLEGAARLDTSLPYLRPVSVCPGIDAQWGLPVLIRMIERAARGVAKRHPGSVLNVGDISTKRGGDLFGHHSHESGRDADIGFYVVDAKGNPIKTRSFIKFDASLASKELPGARFDVARNWLLIQHMLSDPAARVSHIFIAEPLRQVLLAHARSRGVSRALWNRAAIAMVQPSNSLPHDDHIHVRISCPRSYAGAGECIELAKNVRPSKRKLARDERARRRNAHASLRTPSAARSGRAADSQASSQGSAKASRGSTEKAGRSAGSQAAPLSAQGSARQGSVLSRVFDAVDRALTDAPGISQEEAEADAVEVKDALDESGAAKITD